MISGFTLAEVLAATAIGAFVALVAIGALRSTSSSASAVQDRSDRAADLRSATRRIAMDLANIFRDQDPNQIRLVGGLENSGFGEQAYLTFWAVCHEKVREGQPEGDVYEVEYYMTQKEDRTLLMRRVWPHPNRNVDPGGVLTVLSDQVELLKVQYFDGQKWASEWPDTAQELPVLIEVSLVGKAAEGVLPAQESFLVTVTSAAAVQAQADLAALQQSQEGTDSTAAQGASGVQ